MLALLAAAALLAQDPPEAELEALETQAETLAEEARARELAAEAAAAEVADLQRRLVEAGERVRVREAEAEAARLRMAELEAEEDALIARLAEDRAGLARVLAALQRIEMADPPALAVSPDDAAEAARAAGLLARIAPELQARGQAINARLAELERLRQDLSRQGAQLVSARDALSLTRSEVTRRIEERRAAEARLRAEASDLSRRAAQAAAEAVDLRALVTEIRRMAAVSPRPAPRREDILDSARDTVPVPRPRPQPYQRGVLVDAQPLTEPAETLRFADMRGRLRPPARGDLAVRSGARGPDGVSRDGIWFETGPGAQVSAPFDGEVVYAGPFQDFEGVLMINTPDGYTLVLGGLGLLFAAEGQSLLTGEPVGVMPDRANPAPMLYLEIRRSSQDADDPEDWLRPEYRRG
ncbi:MAG: peptidoglycan DD-metalloendopeptidase family protein [Oceanicaulis sp.]